MNGAGLVGLAVVAAGVSWVLTWQVRRFALSHAILDIPNARSSHTAPTPRGGGLGIAAVVFGVVAWLAVSGAIERRLAAALLGGGAMVATIGWLDDRRAQPVWLRAAVQLTAAGWAVGCLGGVPALRLGTTTVPLGVAGWVVGVLTVAWGTNLYNFMDGIDGLAGGQAVVAGVVGTVLLLHDGNPGLAPVAAAVAGAGAGFLAWNWSPARIFLGDVGSGLLGFLFATLALASERGGGSPLLAWTLLLGVFVFDASVTLVRRMLRGERWYAAHRSHAYQRAVQAGWSHQRVTGVALLLMMGLGLVAVTAAARPERAWLCVLVALSGLAACYAWIERRWPMAADGH